MTCCCCDAAPKGIVNFTTEDACAAAVGHLECLRRWHKVGNPQSLIALKLAAIYGQLESMKLLHAYGYAWTGVEMGVAAVNNRFACMRFAHTHGCVHSMPMPFIRYAVLTRNLLLCRYVVDHNVGGIFDGNDHQNQRIQRNYGCLIFTDSNDRMCPTLFDGCAIVNCLQCSKKINESIKTLDALLMTISIPYYVIREICSFVCEHFESILAGSN